jgi:DNA polymerase elongation subunit (family B)
MMSGEGLYEIITCEPWGGDNIAIIARDRERDERVRLDVTDFDPYFFVHASQTDRAEEMMENGKEANGEPAIANVIEGDWQSVGDYPLTKIVLHKPGQTPTVREWFDSPDGCQVESWESDINYTMRFRIDTDIKDVFEVEWTKEKIKDGHYEISWTAVTPRPDKDPKFLARNFYFDIEVGGENQAMPEDDDLNPVVCITALDGKTEEMYTWVWRDDLEQEDRRDVWYHSDLDDMIPWEIRRFQSETQMIANFFDFYQNEGFDLLSGWYSDKYDVPYVINRARELDLNPEAWSEMGSVNDGLPQDSWGQANVKGAFMNDLERRYDQISDADQSGLEYVAGEEEEIMSWPQESSNIQGVWQNDLETLLEYNANDVVATWKVDETAGVTRFFLEKMYMTGCRVEEIEQDSNVITYYHLFEADNDEIIPRGKTRTHKDFGGGRVVSPDIQGIVGPVAVLDLSKIYPSIMISLGLSYENAKGIDPVLLGESLTLNDTIPATVWEDVPEPLKDRGEITNTTEDSGTKKHDIGWNFQSGDVVSPLALGKQARKEIWDDLYEMQTDGTLKTPTEWRFLEPGEQHEYEDWLPHDHEIDEAYEGTRLPNGVRIDQDNDGLTTRCLENMFELRWTYGDQRAALDPDAPDYKEKYDRLSRKRQNAKDQINAVFGYTGYKKSPLFKPEIAMTTTFVGRYIIKLCQVIAEDMGHDVIYGDTDSIMVDLKADMIDSVDEFDWHENPRECIYESERLGQYINHKMDDFAENFCDIGRDDHMFELEFEKLYYNMFLGDKKKRYAGARCYSEG